MSRKDNTSPFLAMRQLQQSMKSLSKDMRKAYAGLLVSALNDAKTMSLEDFERKYDL